MGAADTDAPIDGGTTMSMSMSMSMSMGMDMNMMLRTIKTWKSMQFGELSDFGKEAEEEDVESAVGSAAVRMVQLGGTEAAEEDIDESAVGSAAVRMVQLGGTEAEEEDMESAVGSAVVRMVDSGMLLSMDLSMGMSMPATA